MTAFDDLASSGNLRYLTNRQLNKAINDFKNSAENTDMHYDILFSTYLDGIQAAARLTPAQARLPAKTSLSSESRSGMMWRKSDHHG